MRVRVTTYKMLGMSFIPIFSIIMLSFGLALINEEINYGVGVLLISISSISFIGALFIPSRLYMRWQFNHFYNEGHPDCFMIFAAKMVSLDSHYSEKERKRVSKYINREFRPDYSQLKINNFDVLVKDIDEFYQKFKFSVKSLTRINRLRLMNNLVGIALVDRFLSDKEKDFLENLVDYFGLTSKDLSLIFEMYSYVSQEETEYQKTLKTKSDYSNHRSYSILGLEPTATQKEVRDAYRELAKVYHPDKQRGSKESKNIARAQFQVIAQAYEVIKKEKGN
jgi:DnaJ like chaperone protein